MIVRGVAVVALALAAGAACGDEPTPPGGDADLRVLFLGNSLTYTNDLPQMLRLLAAADGRAFETRDASQANFALEDHWQASLSRAAVNDGPWDAVIMQQGPSSLPQNRANLVTWTGVWAEAIRADGAVPGLYMVWPDASRLAFFDDVSTSYQVAADSAGTALYPAGEAWRAAWARDSTLALYGPDDFHPSVMGTYLAALVIYRGLTGREPPSLDGIGISAADDAVLQAAARDAHSSFGRTAR